MSTQQISGTAFLVNYHRAKFEDISKDIYAKYWVTPEAISLSEKLSKEVYANDDIEICLRNRFFLENIKSFIKKNKECVFVNLGAGFTSYPYLCEGVETIEVDFPHIVEFKKSKTLELMNDGKLPKRTVTYISADLQNTGDLDRLHKEIKKILGNKKSFFLLEGVTYYISPVYLKRIFQIIDSLQPKGSEIGIEYWTPDLLKNNVFKKLAEYAEKHFNYRKEDFQLYDTRFFQDHKDYELMELTTTARFEKYFKKEPVMSDESKNMVTYMGILEKR